jgi:phosphoesterase RecJ-like protein
MNVTSNPEEAVQRLLRARRVLVTSHRSPDGDALGSELALADLARSCSVEAHIVNRDPAPRGLSELPGTETIQVRPDLPAGFPCGYDLVVMVECPDLDRPGFDNLTAAPILNIDHHRSNARYGEVNFLDEEAPAAGEMVWQMFRAAGVAPSPHAATNAYVALTTDTGDFRYSNATPRAFHAAAEMVAAGARPEHVAGGIHERGPPDPDDLVRRQARDHRGRSGRL